MKQMTVLLLVVIGLSHGSVFAADCDSESGLKHWSELNKVSEAFGRTLLEAQGRDLTISEQQQALVWLELVESTATQIDDVLSLKDVQSTRSLVEAFRRRTTSANTWTLHSDDLFGFGYDPARRGSGLPDQLYLDGDGDGDGGAIPVELVEVETKAFNEQCSAAMSCGGENGNACRIYLDGWASAVNVYKSAVVKRQSEIIMGLAVAYGKAWDSYFDDARSQTSWDRWLTARINSTALKNDAFALPPKYQYFFLHPSVLVEYVDHAADGNQFEAALAVEWIGINRWQGCFNTDIACGASLVSTYSDRAGVDDVGHGVMFHVDNSYSFGATARGSDVGFFLTVDLLKAFEDKKSQVTAWQEKANDVLGK